MMLSLSILLASALICLVLLLVNLAVWYKVKDGNNEGVQIVCFLFTPGLCAAIGVCVYHAYKLSLTIN